MTTKPRVEQTKISEHLLNTISSMDIFDLCDCLEDDSIDMILCDLPYGITDLKSWDSVIPFNLMWESFTRIIKPKGAIVLTASGKFTYQLVASNLEWFKYEWVWVKSRATDHVRAKLKPMSKHEMVLVFSDGTLANCSQRLMNYYPQGVRSVDKQVTRKSTKFGNIVGNRSSHRASYKYTTENYPSDIIIVPSEHNVGLYHPTQKPVALFEYLIRTYTQAGQVVFDPCVGSGTTAIAARNTGRNFICGDSSAEYVQVARERLVLPYTLPLFEEVVVEDVPVQVSMGL